jgi:aspartyl-tRNA(Asn)/glutamyl-tRNA(Gln) amidotransferase subunit C
MTIDRSLIEYLESLARIRLNEDERAATETDLQNIIAYFDQLNNLDTRDVEPLSHSFPVVNVMREDIVTPSLPPETLLANAPREKDNCFLIQRVMD